MQGQDGKSRIVHGIRFEERISGTIDHLDKTERKTEFQDTDTDGPNE